MPEIKLESSSGKCYSVDVKVAECSKTIKRMLECLGTNELDENIPLAHVTSSDLEYILEWANHHKDDESFSKDVPETTDTVHVAISEWDWKFLSVCIFT